MERLKKIMRLLFQMMIDVIVGIAMHYCLVTFIPAWNESKVLVVTLIATALFAEVWEIKAK